MNNYWHTNYKAEQGGRFRFRFSLTSSAGGFSKRKAVADGWNMYCPPVAQRGAGEDKPLLSALAKSLVKIKPADLPLTTIKEAEDETGFVFHLCDYDGASGTAKLFLPEPARDVFQCNLVETDPRRLDEHGKTIAIRLKPFSPVTLKIPFSP